MIAIIVALYIIGIYVSFGIFLYVEKNVSDTILPLYIVLSVIWPLVLIALPLAYPFVWIQKFIDKTKTK